MIKLNCGECKNHCCGRIPHITPLLIPDEVELFKDHSESIVTPHQTIWYLKKKIDGNCVFFDEETAKCLIYNERPMECRIYPFLLDLNKEPLGIKLDKRFCPQIAAVQPFYEQAAACVRNLVLPKDWIAAYESVDGC